ncbi:MAG: hypothetical protein ABI212_10345 [Burkholderiaceae bacterium]
MAARPADTLQVRAELLPRPINLEALEQQQAVSREAETEAQQTLQKKAEQLAEVTTSCAWKWLP